MSSGIREGFCFECCTLPAANRAACCWLSTILDWAEAAPNNCQPSLLGRFNFGSSTVYSASEEALPFPPCNLRSSQVPPTVSHSRRRESFSTNLESPSQKVPTLISPLILSLASLSTTTRNSCRHRSSSRFVRPYRCLRTTAPTLFEAIFICKLSEGGERNETVCAGTVICAHVNLATGLIPTFRRS